MSRYLLPGHQQAGYDVYRRETQTGHSWTCTCVCVCVCVCVWTVGSLIIFALSLSCYLLYSLSDPFCHPLCPCPPSPLSFLAPLHPLIVSPSLLSFQYPPHPSFPPSPCPQRRVRKVNFPTRFLLVTPPSILLSRLWVRRGLVSVKLGGHGGETVSVSWTYIQLMTFPAHYCFVMLSYSVN